MKRLSLVLCLTFSLTTTGWTLELWGVDVDGLEVNTGISWFSNSVEDSAPDPLVMNAGVSIPFRFFSYFTFRPESLFFLHTYGFENGRAIPLEPMFDSVVFLTWIINPALGVEYPLLPELTLGAELVMGFFVRTPVFFLGKGGAQALDTTGWFYSGRFFFPGLEVHGIWQFSELFALTARGYLFYPVFNHFTGAPWYDQLGLTINLGLRFSLPDTLAPSVPAEAPPVIPEEASGTD